MSLGRISGPLLKANLQRDGVDLAFETDLLYLSVSDPNPANWKIGIKTDTPTYDFEINGTLKAASWRLDELNLGNNGAISGNIVITDGHINTLVGDWHIQAEPVTGKVIIDSNTKINGNLEVTGDITLGGTINIGNFNDDLVVFNGEIGSSFVPDITDTYDIGTSLKRWNNGYYKKGYFGNIAIDTNVIQANTANTSLNLTPTGTGTVNITGTTAFKVPTGTEGNKSNFTAAQGQIRYNTTSSQFEGYSGTNWSSLGGVRSVDNLTYITAESSPAASDDTIRFYNNNILTTSVSPTEMTIDLPVTIQGSKLFTLKDANNDAYVAFQAPDSVDSSYIIKLPASQPIDHTVLTNDGAGNTSWSRPDTFGGNRIYTSDTYGDDANDGINLPVKTIKRACQLAANLGQKPAVNPGEDFYNAKRLLEDNRSFIQEETIAFINWNFVSFNTHYNETTCRRDTGYIVDAARYDAALGTNYNAVTAGLSYQRSDTNYLQSYQNIQTLGAINYAKTQAATSTSSNATAQTRSNAAFNEIIDIITNGTGAANALTFPSPTGAAQDLIDAKNQLQQNRTFIRAEIVAYVNNNNPPAGYDQTLCSRDVGYIVDALTYDILYGGNTATRRAADAYFAGATSQLGAGQATATANAYEYLKTVVDYVVRGVSLPSPQQVSIIQDISTYGAATASESTTLQNLIQIIRAVILAGNTSGLPAAVYPSLTWVAAGILTATNQLNTDKTTIINNTISFITTTYNGFVYNSTLCKRDVGIIIDAVIYDIILGGNRRSVEAGQSYLAVSAVMNDQKTETITAINFARDLAISVIQNEVVSVYQGSVSQVRYSTISGASAASAITAKFNIITDIINTGVSPAIVEPNFTTIPVTIQVASGDFYIDNPIIIPDKVSVVGDSLRSVVIRPLNANKDMFRVRNGAYLTGFTFRDGLNGSDVPTYTWSWAVAFDDPSDTSVDRIGYFGLSKEKPTITLSPYIQNCSVISFLGGNGALVDGSKVVTPNIPVNTIEAENPVNIVDGIPEYGKSMVANAFTMLSFGGTGWLITNDAYAQIVSCFQIFMLNGSYCQSGGYLSITNSATNFGLYALRASGYSPNSFAFDRGVIADTGTVSGSITLTTIGTKRVPVSQFVIRIKNSITNLDITSNFKEASVEKSFNAATDVNPTTNEITINSHGFTNSQSVYYSNNGSPDILGLVNNGMYYVQIVNGNKFILYNDDSLSYQVNIQAVGSGVHKIIANTEEFFVDDILSSHSSYQELTLPSGPSYSFVPGQQLLGLTNDAVSTAFVYSWAPATRKLIISNEYTVVDGNPYRIAFTATSTITEVGGLSVNYDVDSVININNVYYTATFKATSTISGNQLLDSTNTLLQHIHLHRPSIVNSSAHTWEYSGSGTDYNALPQNGGAGKGTAYEQYSELPGRVYTSGTNELGDFKVGDFIIAENKTGNITFKTQVTIGELNVLKLSLSEVEVSQFSTDPGLGDNEPGGASNSRISVQRAVRTFIANRLGNVLDKDVSTNAVPGAVVQLNSQGQINQDLLPPARGITTHNVSGWGNRIYLADKIPAIEVISGDNASESYTQIALTINSAVTWDKGDIITQTGTSGYGIVKQNYVSATEVILVNSSGTWNTSGNLKKNGTTLTGTTISIIGEQVSIVDNYYLKKDTSSQFLILSPGITYNFTGIPTVTGANSAAQGNITSGPVYGIAYQLDSTGLFGGTGYTPASGTLIYFNVPLTNVSSSGTGAKANITVTNGVVASVEITVGGTGYIVGDTLSASTATIGGTGSGFYIPVLRADTRLYVDLVGNYIKFTGSPAAPEYIEDANAGTVSIANLAAVSQANFDARDTTVGGAVNYSLSTITIPLHGYVDGDPIVYSNGGNISIGNLINNKTYWAKVVDPNTVELYNNYGFTSGSKVVFGASSSGLHNFKLYTVGTSNNFFYVPNHGLITTQPVRFSATNPPTGISNNAFYFVGSVTTNGFTLHTNRSDAAASVLGIIAGATALSSSGTGSATLVKQNIQVIGTLNTSSKSIDNWGQIAQSTIDASNIVSGTVGPTRLGSTGTATNKTFLRGDSSWQYAIQNIKLASGTPLSVIGDYYTTGLVNYYYNSLTLDIARADEAGGDIIYTSLGVAAFNKSQFNVNSNGQATIKNGVVDAGTLDGQDGTYYTDPANIVGQVSVAKGGTGLSTVSKGDLLYSGSNGSLTQLNIGATNTILTSISGVPAWSSTFNLTSGVVSANSSTDALRITQIGSGNALVVEDSANPDSTRFVIDNVGVVTTANNIIVDTATDATGIQVSGSFGANSSYVGVLADSGGYGRMEFGGSSGAYLDFKTPNGDDYDLRIIVDSTTNKIITVGDLTINNLSNGGTIISNSSTATALRITQTGTGNALVVEDSSNPDSTPFIIDANGNTAVGGTPTGSYKLEVLGTSYFSSNVTVSGDLVVNGNTTTVNSTTLTVDDKNIELGAVVAIANVTGTISGTATTTTITGITSTSGMIPGQALTKNSGTGAFGGTTIITSVDSLTQITITSTTANTAGAIVFNVGGATDITANGGGITLKGATDKTITYDNTNTRWQSNIGVGVNGLLTVGTGSAAGTITSQSTQNLVLNTNAGTNSGTITINQGANGNIDLTANGTGNVNVASTTINLGTSASSANTVNIGGAITGNTLKIAGTAAGTINLTTDVTTGSVSMFPSLTTATMTVGSAAAGAVAIAFNKASTSITTGALTVAGGVGIAGNLYANVGYFGSLGGIVINGATIVRTNGDLKLIGGGAQDTRNSLTLVNGAGSVLYGGSATTNSPTTASYGIVLAGGDGNVKVTNSTTSTSTTSGALVVTGGVGIGENLYVGGITTFSGNTVINGDLTVNGTTTSINVNSLTIDDKNIELGSVATLTSISGTISSTATTTTVTGITSTVGMIPGQALTKVSGAGAFGGTTTITSVDSATQITVTSTTANTAGAIVFDVGGATDITANGGGITLKGATDKTIIYDNANTRWQSNISFGVNGLLIVGTGSAAGTITSQSTQNLVLNTNSGTNSGTITINQGANSNIDVTPNGTGKVDLITNTTQLGVTNTATTLTTNGTGNLTISTNNGTNSGTVVINQGANANIDITPNGTGNINAVSTTINLGTSTTAATTVKVGGAFTGNTLKIAGTAAGTINLTTDVTTGAVSVFSSLTTATMTIGSANAGTVAIAFNKASTSTTTGALTVAGGVGINGALNALTKSFVIPHPTKKGKLLRHGSLEGPEFGVYVRGRCTGNVIELPEYWTGLVDEDSITVDLTPIGKHQKLYIEKIEGNKVYIANDAMFGKGVNCFYTVWGERKDVDSLGVEVDE